MQGFQFCIVGRVFNMSSKPSDNVIEISRVSNFLGGTWVHRELNFTVRRGEIVAIVGGSGSGKTTLLRNMLMLLRPQSGSIKVLGQNVLQCTEREAFALRQRWGVLFQHSSLFSSLTLLENILFPLQEFYQLPHELAHEIALLKIAFVGLPLDSAYKYPSELSGGMQKRAAAARAIAMDPELLLLDEPTSGLDPKSASAIDELVLHLRNMLGLTIVFITHDPSTLRRVPDRIAFLGEGKVLAEETLAELMKNPNPTIRDYFDVPETKEK